MASISLQDLRRRLYVKAKAEKMWRFWGLYVHVAKLETLLGRGGTGEWRFPVLRGWVNYFRIGHARRGFAYVQMWVEPPLQIARSLSAGP